MRITSILAILLIGISLVFTACSSTASPTTPTPTQQAPTTPKTAPTLTPSPLPPPIQQSELPLQIVSVSSPVSQGAEATLVAQTAPGAECDIAVHYQSGKSTASGLSPKTADSNGRVSWTWKVGAKTTPGSWKIVITASYGGKTVSQTTYFEIK